MPSGIAERMASEVPDPLRLVKAFWCNWSHRAISSRPTRSVLRIWGNMARNSLRGTGRLTRKRMDWRVSLSLMVDWEDCQSPAKSAEPPASPREPRSTARQSQGRLGLRTRRE